MIQLVLVLQTDTGAYCGVRMATWYNCFPNHQEVNASGKPKGSRSSVGIDNAASAYDKVGQRRSKGLPNITAKGGNKPRKLAEGTESNSSLPQIRYP